MNGLRIQLSLCCLVVSATAVALFDSYTHRAGAIAFNISSSDSTPTWALDSVTQASNMWSSSFADDMTVNLDVRFAPLDDGLLGYTDVTEQTFDYWNVYEALSLDSSSAYDARAVQSLPSDGTIELLTNYTSDHPLGYGSPLPYLDNDGGLNNQRIRMTTANAKALNLFSNNLDERLRLDIVPATDAVITLNSSVKWDIDRSDGIAPNAYDFLGVAAHEIGHALGFVSGTDLLDESSPFSVNGMEFHFPEDTFATVSPLDLFRFSDESVAYGAGVIDWTASATDKYFSIDGGQSPVLVMSADGMTVQPALFSTGLVHGDSNSSSHWKTGLNLGLMQPLLNPGTPLDLTPLDAIALDVIGFDAIRFNSVTFDDSEQNTLLLPATSSPTPPTPDPSILAEPILFPEVAIAAVPGDVPAVPHASTSRLAIRSAQSSTSTEIPEPRSALGMVAAIALTATGVAQRRRKADA